jgi:hypothetical protein
LRKVEAKETIDGRNQDDVVVYHWKALYTRTEQVINSTHRDGKVTFVFYQLNVYTNSLRSISTPKEKTPYGDAYDIDFIYKFPLTCRFGPVIITDWWAQSFTSTPAMAVNGGSLNGGSFVESSEFFNGSLPLTKPFGLARTSRISSRVYHRASDQ